MQTTTRNANLSDLVTLLTEQHARRLDVVAPAAAITARDGDLVLRGTDVQLSDDGVTTADGTYTPTAVCDEGLADKLGVPVGYVKRMRVERPDLWDANVNGWLHGRRPLMRTSGHLTEYQEVRPGIPGDPRSFLVRCFRGDDTEQGIARAFLSDRYSIVDNLDVLMACLDGVREAGIDANVTGGDLTERRMTVRVDAPGVTALAPVLLDGYRSPFTGESGTDNPVVSAGFRLTNSETGGGAFTIAPVVTVLICRNGMTMTRDAIRSVHLGSRLDPGTVRWAEDTQEKNMELVKAKTRDAVSTFLSADYLALSVAHLEQRASEVVGTSDEAVQDVTRPLGYTAEHMAGVLDYFRRGGQFTRAGVVNAITAYSQTVTDADAAHDLDAAATRLLLV
jgi:hypothetical protein